MKSMLTKKYEKGLSLIEASMVLALSAIVISGVMFYYQSASDSNKTQNTISEVMSTIAAINGLYVGQSSYEGLDNEILWHSSAIPNSYKGNSPSITNPFGGHMEVHPGTGDNADKYAITLTEIPQSACLNIASMNLGTSLVGVGANFSSPQEVANQKVNQTPASGGSDQAGKVSAGQLYSSMTPAAAAQICSKADNSNDSISFVMR